jgi:hypothetical protein
MGNITDIFNTHHSLLNVCNIKSTQTYVDNKLQYYIDDFVKTTSKNITLLKNDVTINKQWPHSWFVFHPVESTFWFEWFQYISDCMKIVTDKAILSKYNLCLSVIESASETYLLKCLNEKRFEAADTNVCKLSLFDIDTNIDTVLYNYGGFDQHIYRLIDNDIVMKYIKDNNIEYNTTSYSINDINPGLFTNRYI